MDLSALAESRNVDGLAGRPNDDLVVSVCAVPAPYVVDRLIGYGEVAGALAEAIPVLTAVAPEPFLPHRGRFGFVSPIGLRRLPDGLAGPGFRYWHDGTMSVETRYPDLEEESQPHLVREALVYSLAHVGAATRGLGDERIREFHIHAITGSPMIGSASAVPAMVEGVVPLAGVGDLAALAQVLAHRVTFPREAPSSPFSDGGVMAALASAIGNDGPGN